MTKVLMVDDSLTVRSLYEGIIWDSGRYLLVDMLENAKAAALYCQRNPVDLVLMDVYTRDRENGLEAAAQIKQMNPEIRIIILTSLPEASFLEKAREARCESFWYKEQDGVSLLEVMDRTMAGESVYPEKTPEIQIGLAKSVEFTRTEMRVLRQLCEGKVNHAIAQELGISENTVKYHINNMLTKAGYNSKFQLAIDAVEKKLIVPGF